MRKNAESQQIVTTWSLKYSSFLSTICFSLYFNEKTQKMLIKINMFTFRTEEEEEAAKSRSAMMHSCFLFFSLHFEDCKIIQKFTNSKKYKVRFFSPIEK